MKRMKKGFKFYIESMAKSTNDKAKKILPLAQKSLKSTRGDILDLGAGGGDLSSSLLSLAKEFDVGLTIVDIDHRMIKILKNKFAGQSKVEVATEDVLNLNLGKAFSTAICSSLLHEIFSRNKNIDDLKRVLRNIRNHLLPGGTLIIRDGIKPNQSQKIILLKPLKSKVCKRFWKFVASYKYLEMAPHSVKIDGEEYIAISQELAYEFAVKYRYPEINWQVEMEEQFGFWTGKEARSFLEETGFEIVYFKKYFLDYFKTLFPKDFELFEKNGNKIAKLNYFNTHLVIAARRI